MDIVIILLAVIAALVILAWVGLQVGPAPFPPFPGIQPELGTVPLPEDLPAPVARFYTQTCGEGVPLIRSVVLSGRGTMRLGFLTFPVRFRFTHEAGYAYRHDIDLCWFGLPIMRGYETFIDGHGWAKTPGGTDEGDGFDQGSTMSLWAEALTWFPSLLVTDSRVRWELVDEATALVKVPFGAGEDSLLVRFDGASGGIQHIEAMKYRSATRRKELWVSGVWHSEGKPWLNLQVESALYNVAVADAIRAERPNIKP